MGQALTELRSTDIHTDSMCVLLHAREQGLARPSSRPPLPPGLALPVTRSAVKSKFQAQIRS